MPDGPTRRANLVRPGNTRGRTASEGCAHRTEYNERGAGECRCAQVLRERSIVEDRSSNLGEQQGQERGDREDRTHPRPGVGQELEDGEPAPAAVLLLKWLG